MNTTASTQIDIRTMPPKDRHPRILETFASLEEGSDFVLTSDHDPRPLLYQLQAEQAGSFDWSPLEEGPEVWRIRIHRRAPGSAPGRGVSEYLAWDHDRLDGLLAQTRDTVARGAADEARRLFGEFRTGLLRHIRMEEEVLFPAFEQVTGMSGAGPTVVMRMEHREIQGILDSMRTYMESSPLTEDRFQALESSLTAVLAEHNAKEEHIVYPMTDHHHTPDAKDGLVRKMQLV